MQWSKKLEALQRELTKELKVFLAPRLKGANAAEVSQDIVKQAFRIDMNRSAARLRRMLYAQWGRLDLVAGEFFALTAKGLEQRPAPGLGTLGELHLDPFRLFSAVKMLGYPGEARLSLEDRVKASHVVVKVMHRLCLQKLPVLTARQVALLMVAHSFEAGREVDRAKMLPHVAKHFPQWNIPAPSPQDLEADVQALLSHGLFVPTKEGSTVYRLAERLTYIW